MSSILENLKNHLRSYSKIDNQLQDLNKQTYDLRTARRDIENHMASILSGPDFTQIDKIQLTEDNSFVKIQRPGWNKPWNVSKKELKTMLDAYFNSTSTCTADDCFNFIVNSSKERLVSTEFNFTRVKND
jgi:hypothetical protein